MKWIFGFFLLCMTLLAAGRELDLSGDFTGEAAQWFLHEYEGFQPPAKVSSFRENGTEREILSIRSVRGNLGALLLYRVYFPAVKGDSVQISLRVRGKGVGAVCLHFFTEEGKWNGPSRTHNIKLKDHWENVTVTLPVINGFAGRTRSFRICIGCGPHSEMEASDIKAVFQDAEK